MDTERLAGDERPLEVGAEDPRARRRRPGSRASAASRSSSGAVMIVGWNAVTPLSSRASPARL